MIAKPGIRGVKRRRVIRDRVKLRFEVLGLQVSGDFYQI